MARHSLSVALPDQHARLADGPVPDARPPRDAGRRARCGIGSPGRARVRLGLVPERLANRPGGAGDLRANPEWRREFEETLPDLTDDDIAGSGFAIRLHRPSRSGRRCGAGPLATAAARTRIEVDARLRPQPHGPGSSVDRRAPGLLHPWQRGRPGPLAAQLHPSAHANRVAVAGARPRPVLRRLARHAAAQLWPTRDCSRR